MRYELRKIFGWVVGSLFFFSACSSSTPKKSAFDDTPATERFVFGRITDANADSRPSLTYALSDFAGSGMFSAFVEKSPDFDPATGYFSTMVPVETRHFGIRTMKFSMKGRSGSVTLRNEGESRGLFGVDLPKGADPVYVGDIVLRSGVKKDVKSGDALSPETFDLKSIELQSNDGDARKFLVDRGMDPEGMFVRTFAKKDWAPKVE